MIISPAYWTVPEATRTSKVRAHGIGVRWSFSYRLGALKRSVLATTIFAREEFINKHRESYRDMEKVDKFQRLLRQVDQMIEDIRTEIDGILLATVKIR